MGNAYSAADTAAPMMDYYKKLAGKVRMGSYLLSEGGFYSRNSTNANLNSAGKSQPLTRQVIRSP